MAELQFILYRPACIKDILNLPMPSCLFCLLSSVCLQVSPSEKSHSDHPNLCQKIFYVYSSVGLDSLIRAVVTWNYHSWEQCQSLAMYSSHSCRVIKVLYHSSAWISGQGTTTISDTTDDLICWQVTASITNQFSVWLPESPPCHYSCCIPSCLPSVNTNLLNNGLDVDYENIKPNCFTATLKSLGLWQKRHKERISFGSHIEGRVHCGC